MRSRPRPDDLPEIQKLRSQIFTDLDRLAFALEMEASELHRAGRDAEAEHRNAERLGVRLAQRLVAGVWAEEVDQRVITWAEAYNQRLGGTG